MHARQLLITTRSQLYLSGLCPAGLGCSPPGGRFTAPVRLLLTGGSPAAEGDGGEGRSSAGAGSVSPASLGISPASASSRLSAGNRVSVKAVAATADFAVLLAWEGGVLDTRAQRSRQGGGLDWSGIWRPPCGRAVSVAAGGCWQGKCAGRSGVEAGLHARHMRLTELLPHHSPLCAAAASAAGSGHAGGHVVAVAADGAVFAWGCNSAGQLGLASSAAAGAEPAGGNGRSWLSSPVEVVDAALAAAMGQPTAAACGDEHAVLLCRSGRVWSAGSNAVGACGLPIVQLRACAWSEVSLPAGEQAASVSAGGRNTAVVTARGRLLCCGANELGQAGVGRLGGACFLLADIGPSAAWHGMRRVSQQAGGGGGEAAARVVQAACGSGSLYALTDSGEAFSWGQGGQGEASEAV